MDAHVGASISDTPPDPDQPTASFPALVTQELPPTDGGQTHLSDTTAAFCLVVLLVISSSAALGWLLVQLVGVFIRPELVGLHEQIAALGVR